ncbi:hypothetical protein [Proteiniborus sp. MB09-C3]|uniref:hypothetical protein n=1 Tax=Proteiniborus sp. MB09-C3 TaxID=3050072 RepID=UPI002556AECD|nr:hypothetical protein [Proteiniborus sp. MB09-C3]WIV12442.1 hypothetical protein QO263_01570 [Proteiniborus sp. MB09-C3]
MEKYQKNIKLGLKRLDLIYVIEYCIENKLLEYKIGVSMYMDVLNTRNIDKLNEIKSRIKSLINFNEIKL